MWTSDIFWIEAVLDLEKNFFEYDKKQYKSGLKNHFPVNDKMLDWLNREDSVREALWNLMVGKPASIQSGIRINPDDDIQVRYEMLRAVESGQMNISEACENFGFSRETYYKYLKAYKESGIAGLITEHRGPRGHRNK